MLLLSHPEKGNTIPVKLMCLPSMPLLTRCQATADNTKQDVRSKTTIISKLLMVLDAFEVITSSWTLDQLQSLRNERNELTSASVSAFSKLLSKDRDEKVYCVMHVVQVSSRVRLGICIDFSIIRAVSENMNVLVAATMSSYLS